MNRLCFVCVVMFGLFFSGCATLTDGAYQDITLIASDRQAVIATIGKQKVRLPAQVKIPRKGVLIAILEQDNPNYHTSKVHSMVVGATIDNPKQSTFVGIGLIDAIPAIIDSASGAKYKYSNEQFIIPVSPKTCNIK